MTLIFAENFDALTPPALPSGWTNAAADLITATDQFVSSPNSLKHNSDGTGALIRDTGVGVDDYVMSANVRLGAVIQAVYFGVREQTTDPLTNDYNLSVSSGGLTIQRRGNTTANLATVSATVPTATWLYMALKCEGDLLSGKLQDTSTGDWLQTDGTWGASEVWALETTDSSWTDGGTVFVAINNSNVAFTCWVDDIEVNDLTVASGSFAATPGNVPISHVGDITLTLVGTDTAWDGSTTFTVSGVTGTSKTGQTVTDATHATVTISTGSTTGVLTVSDGSASDTVTVSTPSVAVSPTTQEANTSSVFVLTGTATVWDQEDPSTLFSVSGVTGATITDDATVASDLSATIPVDLGAATGTLTITDNSTGKTHDVTITDLADLLLMIDGNSLTAAESSTEPGTGNWPTKIANYLQPDWLIVNNADSGRTTQQMEAGAATEVDPRYSADRTRCILVAWECRNDIVVNSITGAQAYANFRDYCAERKAIGWHVIALTMLPTSAVDETTRGTVNDSIRANWRTFAHALADVAADQRIGDGGDEDDTTYYVDTTHMTSAGYDIIAQYVAGALGSVQTGGADTGGNIKYWDGSAWVVAVA